MKKIVKINMLEDYPIFVDGVPILLEKGDKYSTKTYSVFQKEKHDKEVDDGLLQGYLDEKTLFELVQFNSAEIYETAPM